MSSTFTQELMNVTDCWQSCNGLWLNFIVSYIGYCNYFEILTSD